MNFKEYYKQNLFKSLFSEGTKKNLEREPDKENIESDYKTPHDIKDIMSRFGGDDSLTSDYAERHTSHDMGVRRGAESVDDSNEDITPNMRAERERSREIIASAGQNVSITHGNVLGHQYSNQEIADILNAQGERSRTGKPLSKQDIDYLAKAALAKLKKHLSNDMESH